MDKRQQLRESLLAQGFTRTAYTQVSVLRSTDRYSETWVNGNDKVKITWGAKQPCIHRFGFNQLTIDKEYVCEDCGAPQPCTNHYSDGSKIFPNRECHCGGSK